MRRAPSSTLAALLLAACSSSGDGPNPDPRCQPINAAPHAGAAPGTPAANAECLLPWPSSFYETADSSTATGLRLAIPDGVLPQNLNNVPMNPARLNARDGFSPATALVANLRAFVDESKLPHDGDAGASIAASSTVQLLRFDTGERVPLFAEVDHNVPAGASEDQVLVAHPLVRLQPKTRYVAALIGLVDTAGKPIHVAPFDALVAKSWDHGSRLAAIAPRYDELFALLEAHGVPRASLTLAWDFTTGSDEQLLSHTVAMRDQALAAWQAQGLGYQATTMAVVANDPHLWLDLEGTFDVPTFLATDKTGSPLATDASGHPMLRGVGHYPFVLHVPQCAKTATHPLPLLVYGHGFFGTAKGEMDGAYQKQVIDDLCMIEVGTNWIGMATDDALADIGHVFTDFTNLPQLTDPLQQAMVNFVVLARLAKTKLKDDPFLAQMNGGKPLTDGSELYYYGISQGGIFGGTVMALSPDIARGALGVPGGEYSLMMFRSHDFGSFKDLLDGTYGTQRDQQLLVALSQSDFDFTDPITFAPYSIMHPLNDEHGMPMAPKRILLQESKNDAQVPNVATRVVARTMGLPLLAPGIEPVDGIPSKSGPLDAAYTQWSVNPMPVPEDVDVPPAKDNGAHEAIRRLPQLIDQLRQFYRPNGQVVDTCGGKPCVFAAPM